METVKTECTMSYRWQRLAKTGDLTIPVQDMWIFLNIQVHRLIQIHSKWHKLIHNCNKYLWAVGY